MNWGNIFPDYKHNFELCDKKSFWNCDTLGFSYDCDSVMHYAKDQISINVEDTIGKSFFLGPIHVPIPNNHPSNFKVTFTDTFYV